MTSRVIFEIVAAFIAQKAIGLTSIDRLKECLYIEIQISLAKPLAKGEKFNRSPLLILLGCTVSYLG